MRPRKDLKKRMKNLLLIEATRALIMKVLSNLDWLLQDCL